MRKKLFKIGIAVVGLIVTTAVVAGISYAQKGIEGEGKFLGKDQVRMGMMENDDFDAWKEMMQKKGTDEGLITEDNFAKMKEVHTLAQEGKWDEVKAIKEELGDMGFWKMGRKGKMEKMKKGIDPEQKETMINALENNDYQAWKDVVGEEHASEVTEDEFPRLIEAHNLMQQGKEKFEQAREIKEDIGLKAGPNRMIRHKW